MRAMITITAPPLGCRFGPEPAEVTHNLSGGYQPMCAAHALAQPCSVHGWVPWHECPACDQIADGDHA